MTAIRELLKTEEGAANVFIWGTCALGAAAFVAALVAMAVMR
jgi:hypothetical protein